MNTPPFLAPALCNWVNGAEAPKDGQPSADHNLPNVIVIYADDLGYGDLQCYGDKNVKTPHVDRLAAEGIRFTNAHAVAATSTPSRYSLLTGEYAWRRPDTDIAAGNAGMIIRPGQYTMADMFHHAGYATAAIGKWHLGLGDRLPPKTGMLPCRQLWATWDLIIITSWQPQLTGYPVCL